MPLTILTLNVQGFRAPAKQVEVIKLARNLRCDLLMVQETHFTCFADVISFTQRNNVRAFFSFGTTHRAGVGIIVLNNSLLHHSFARYDTDGRVISFECFVGHRKLRFVNIYAPARTSDTNSFFAALHRSFMPRSDVILCGDFNCVLDSERDLRGPGRGRPTWNARELKRLVNQRRLTDAWTLLHGSLYSATWTRASSSSRLDRFYVPTYIQPYVTACRVITTNNLNVHVSDHSALLLCIEVSRFRTGQGAARWKLDTSLLYDDAVVREAKAAIEARLGTRHPKNGSPLRYGYAPFFKH